MVMVSFYKQMENSKSYKKSNGVVFVWIQASVPTYAIIPIPYFSAKARFSNYFSPTELSTELEPGLYKKLIKIMFCH